jgi:hypothetical protein
MTFEASHVIETAAAALIVGYVRQVARDVHELTQNQTTHEGRLSRLEERTRNCKACIEGKNPTA